MRTFGELIKPPHEAPTPRQNRCVGVLVPWANHAVEAELWDLCQSAVELHFARLVPASRTTELSERFLDDLLDSVPRALTSLSRLHIDRALIACTSAGFAASVTPPRVASGIRIIDAFQAVIASLSALDAQRIVLLTPYDESTGDIEATQLVDRGIEVAAKGHLGLLDEYDRVPTRAWIDLYEVVSSDLHQEVDAVLISCTGIRARGAQLELERRTRRPVVTSNSALAYAAIMDD